MHVHIRFRQATNLPKSPDDRTNPPLQQPPCCHDLHRGHPAPVVLPYAGVDRKRTTCPSSDTSHFSQQASPPTHCIAVEERIVNLAESRRTTALHSVKPYNSPSYNPHPQSLRVQNLQAKDSVSKSPPAGAIHPLTPRPHAKITQRLEQNTRQKATHTTKSPSQWQNADTKQPSTRQKHPIAGYIKTLRNHYTPKIPVTGCKSPPTGPPHAKTIQPMGRTPAKPPSTRPKPPVAGTKPPIKPHPHAKTIQPLDQTGLSATTHTPKSPSHWNKTPTRSNRYRYFALPIPAKPAK